MAPKTKRYTVRAKITCSWKKEGFTWVTVGWATVKGPGLPIPMKIFAIPTDPKWDGELVLISGGDARSPDPLFVNTVEALKVGTDKIAAEVRSMMEPLDKKEEVPDGD